MNRIRIFALRDDSARSIIKAIKRLLPEMEAQHSVVEVDITYEKECNRKVVEEVEHEIIDEHLLRKTDKFYYDFI